MQLAGLQGRIKPAVDQLWIAIFAGDHGVVAEGVSAFPQAVTGQMLHNFVSGGAAISVLARQLEARLEVVDLGTVTSTNGPAGCASPEYRRELQPNFVDGPAMSVARGGWRYRPGRDGAQRIGTWHAAVYRRRNGHQQHHGSSALACACSIAESATSPIRAPA